MSSDGIGMLSTGSDIPDQGRELLVFDQRTVRFVRGNQGR